MLNRRDSLKLTTAVGYTYEQGLVKKQADFERLFHPAVLGT